MAGILDIFGLGTTPSKEFEQSVFSLVEKRLADKRAMEKELLAVRNLSVLAVPDVERQRLAAHYYLILENYIGKEQPKNRVPQEILREQILNKCRPEKAEGNFALLFLPSATRDVTLFERFASAIFTKMQRLTEGRGYPEFIRALETDEDFKGLVKAGQFSWDAFRGTLEHLPPADRREAVRATLKKAVEMLAGKVSEAIGELRTELIFKDTFKEFKDELPFVDDLANMLLVAPDNFLQEERIGLMRKDELEEKLRRKSHELETTVAELSGEKVKISSLSREELEKRVQERTGELRKALEDLKSGRAELEEAKASDEAFLENIGEGLVAIDREWNVILWNKAATTLSGWSKKETMGHPIRNFIKFIHERDKSENASFIEEAMLTGEVRRVEDDIMLVARDGNELFVSNSATPIFNAAGKVTSAIIIFRDITKEKELQQTREEFASLATHELRTPIAAIKGHATLLLDGTAGPIAGEQKEFVERIRHSSERLLALVNAMLNVSRLELGRLAIEPVPTYIPDIADTVLDEILPQIKEKKLEIKKEYDTKLPSVNVDPELTHAIFQNLISNAVKYTPEKGKISIAIAKQKTDILITVSDTGFGIPKKQQSKIFTKMFRADNVQTKNLEGTGLGLYIVKSVIDQAGGKIWFESAENKGTSFFVVIPLSGMKKKEGAKGLT